MLKKELDLFKKNEAATRQRFDLRLKELQATLKKELGRLPSEAAAQVMKGKEQLLETPDFTKPQNKWQRPASFAEIFEQNPGYRPTPRDKKSPEWDRLFNRSMCQ